MVSLNIPLLSFALSPTILPLRSVRHFPSLQPTQRNRSILTRTTCTAAQKKNIIFLGTPHVAAEALRKISQYSHRQDSTFSLQAVVSQPPALVGRKRTLRKSPVHQLADTLSLPTLTPASAKDPHFLHELALLSPDLFITAAYGNFLPRQFLDIAPYGTLNIHPSLLPAFRGAAPVPRALQSGTNVTGVSILYTVLKMDAGPIVAKCERPLEGNEQGPELLAELFETGVDALCDILPSVWDGSVIKTPQDDALATHAPKLSKEEARLTFTENAHIVHNKVRAFAGWPGSWADFVVGEGDAKTDVRLKVVRTKVLRAEGGMCLGVHAVRYDDENDCLAIVCDDGSKIGLLEVQPPGKKVMDARSFWNGLRGKSVERKRVPH